MLVTQKRPRVLRWYLAGPLLYGDWGTSRLYVLGLAFFFTGHASPLFLAAMGVLMIAVAWGYTVICRCFPEGGGVYTAARQIHPLLGVVGATLLLAGYVITAAISLVEAFHYLGVPPGPRGVYILGLCVAMLAVLGVVNWFGAKAAGGFALVVAVVAMGVCLLIALACLPSVKAGLGSLSVHTHRSVWENWAAFVAIVLALSGVESVANMTGVMTEPVDRTARRTILPVLAEVVTLNLVFGIAITGLAGLVATTIPDAVTYAGMEPPPEVIAYRDTAMKVLANATMGPAFGQAASIIFGLLLISAANTAVVAQVSVLYSMAQDGELPRVLTKLNYPGVPWAGLIVACVVPALVLTLERDVLALAELYAIGVCGAVSTNLLSCTANRGLPISRWQRRGLGAVGAVMCVIALTIVATKPSATAFAGGMVGAALGLRAALRWRKAHYPEAIPEPVTGWLSELQREPLPMAPGHGRIMLAARGRFQAEYAVELARSRGAALFAIYVRTLRVMDVAPGSVPRVEDDPQALESLGTAAVLARRERVPFVPIYVTSANIAEEILDYTVTFGCDTLIMGKSRRWALSRAVEGDVIAAVAKHLPDGVALITRESTPNHAGLPGSTRDDGGPAGGSRQR